MKLSEIKNFLGIDETNIEQDKLLSRLDTYSDAILVEILGQEYKTTTITHEFISSSINKYRIPYRPIKTNGDLYQFSGSTWNKCSAVIDSNYIYYDFEDGERYKINLTYGYDDDEIPATITLVKLEIIATLYKEIKDNLLNFESISENFQGVSFSKTFLGITKQLNRWAKLLAGYRKI